MYHIMLNYALIIILHLFYLFSCFFRVQQNADGDINYEDLVYFLDVENQPANLEWQEVINLNCKSMLF